MVMRIVIGVFALLFGGLHFAAGLTQFKSKDPAVRGFASARTCGGICAACMAAAHLAGSNPNWMDALGVTTGCLLICAAAYANGRRSGSAHPSHHIVRGAVAVLLVAGVLIW